MISEERQEVAKLAYPEMKMLIVRHGSTHLNSNDHIRGWMDVPLSEEGKQDALDIGKRLKFNPPDCIFTSDLSRASDTAQAISDATGAPIVEVTKGLRPWDLGEFTGQYAPDVHPHILDYACYKPDEPIPGGESFNSFKNRLLDKIDEITKNYGDKNVAIVTHHRDERLLEGWMLTGQPKDRLIDTHVFFQHGIPPGSYREIILKKDL